MTPCGTTIFPPLGATGLVRLALGDPVYRYREFYQVKDALLRYDHRRDYLNYGYWPDGEATPNPSAALVGLVASRLSLRHDDVLLNLGSGIGQPDVDVLRDFGPRRIIGCNVVPEQVSYANARFASLGISDRVVHRLLPAGRAGDELAGEGVTCAISIEALAEMPGLPGILSGLARLLPAGGRLAFCDVVRTSRRPRLGGRALMAATRLLYGDHWRTEGAYGRLLEDAGFRDVACEPIGGQVYPLTCRHARERMSDPAVRRLPRSARTLAAMNMRSLERLFHAGLVDYAVISAVRA
jgi:cyclopropane fatty-acyl-phospholipid synthase-like methyltransferase